MARYLIEDVKFGISRGGMACGPVEGTVNTTIKLTHDGISKWFTVSEILGVPCFFITDEDVFDRLVEDDLSDEFEEIMNAGCVLELGGIKLNQEYEDLEEDLIAHKGEPIAMLVEYIIEVTRCDIDELDELIARGKGQYIEFEDFA